MSTEISTAHNGLVSGPAPATRPKDQRQALPADGQNLPQQADGSGVRTQDLAVAVSRIQDHVQSAHRELRFSIDKDSGRTVIKVVDSNTDQVIRQIPPEEVLAIARRIYELTEGTLLQVKA